MLICSPKAGIASHSPAANQEQRVAGTALRCVNEDYWANHQPSDLFRSGRSRNQVAQRL